MSSPAASGRRTVQYGSALIAYEPDWRPRRDLAITVHPDLRVTALCPLGRSPEAVDAMVLRKAPWILRQQLRFQDLHPLPAPRRFVSGETFRYLGRQYRLKVSLGEVERVVLKRPFIFVVVRKPQSSDYVRALLEEWTRCRAEVVLRRQLNQMLSAHPSLDVPGTRVQVRRMTRRWGSCARSGTITLNPELVKAEAGCIEYLIAHELCHRRVMNHGPQFVRLLSRIMPDWRQRRDRLNRLAI